MPESNEPAPQQRRNRPPRDRISERNRYYGIPDEAEKQIEWTRTATCVHDQRYHECNVVCPCGHPCNAHDEDNNRGCLAGDCPCRKFGEEPNESVVR